MKTFLKALLWIVVPVLCVALGGVAGYYVSVRMTQTQNTDTVRLEKFEQQTQVQVQQVTSGNTVSDIAKLCTKSVVNITIKEEKKGYTGGSTYSETVLGHGTGVIIRADGYIVTCHHVIEGADIITVTTDDEQEYDAELIGFDEQFDLAVIRVDAKGLPAVKLGDSDAIASGEEVVVIGNPLGEFGSSVSAGVLSAPARELTIAGTPLRLMQTDAAVNPGNSGGAMLDMRGQLIGIVNAKISASGIEGIAFAIPWNSIKDKVESIITNGSSGEKAVLGVSTKDSSCYVDGGTVQCLEITSIREGSAAEQAGLQVGDYLLTVDNKKMQTNDDLTLVIKYHHAGDEVKFEIFRENEKITITVTLGRA